MAEFIKLQLRLYKNNKNTIAYEKLKILATKYLTSEEYKELFKEVET